MIYKKKETITHVCICSYIQKYIEFNHRIENTYETIMGPTPKNALSPYETIMVPPPKNALSPYEMLYIIENTQTFNINAITTETINQEGEFYKIAIISLISKELNNVKQNMPNSIPIGIINIHPDKNETNIKEPAKTITENQIEIFANVITMLGTDVEIIDKNTHNPSKTNYNQNLTLKNKTECPNLNEPISRYQDAMTFLRTIELDMKMISTNENIQNERYNRIEKAFNETAKGNVSMAHTADFIMNEEYKTKEINKYKNERYIKYPN